MKNFLKKTWGIARWPLGILLLAYVILVIYRIPAVGEQERSQETVAQIHAAHITLDDVKGTHLPLPPDEATNNATVAGVDNNNNGIRDDVEVAIFNKYLNSPKIRAAELQYALALQLMLTDVFDTDTWKAAANQYSRGQGCIGLTIPNQDLKTYLSRTKEVEALVVNSDERQKTEDAAFKFTTSTGIPNTDLCDIDLEKL